MPEVYVHAVKGRTLEQKKALMKDITDAVVKNFNAPAEAAMATSRILWLRAAASPIRRWELFAREAAYPISIGRAQKVLTKAYRHRRESSRNVRNPCSSTAPRQICQSRADANASPQAS